MQRLFKARIVDDFHEKWFQAAAKDESITVAEAKVFYASPKFDSLSERISGKEVTMIESSYVEGITDYFEEKDNDYVISRELFTEI